MFRQDNLLLKGKRRLSQEFLFNKKKKCENTLSDRKTPLADISNQSHLRMEKAKQINKIDKILFSIKRKKTQKMPKMTKFYTTQKFDLFDKDFTPKSYVRIESPKISKVTWPNFSHQSISNFFQNNFRTDFATDLKTAGLFWSFQPNNSISRPFYGDETDSQSELKSSPFKEKSASDENCRNASNWRKSLRASYFSLRNGQKSSTDRILYLASKERIAIFAFIAEMNELRCVLSEITPRITNFLRSEEIDYLFLRKKKSLKKVKKNSSLEELKEFEKNGGKIKRSKTTKFTSRREKQVALFKGDYAVHSFLNLCYNNPVELFSEIPSISATWPFELAQLNFVTPFFKEKANPTGENGLILKGFIHPETVEKLVNVILENSEKGEKCEVFMKAVKNSEWVNCLSVTGDNSITTNEFTKQEATSAIINVV